MIPNSGLRPTSSAGWLLAVASLLCTLTVTAAEPASTPDYEYELEEVWIPMPDGVRLAADLYIPRGGMPGEKYPVILEYDPYRKDESRGDRFPIYAYFAERGYIVARVDIRGTGSSEGRLVPHEYSDRELDDGEKVIEWVAAHPLANGKVGMFGISWSGFNAIQLAMRQPPALKTIIPVDATEDLYQDDVHYMDGIMHMDSWEMSQDLYNALPAPPGYVLDQDYFDNRFDTDPWMLTYKDQQRDGPFWDRASARDKYESIRIPSFHIGGWYDGYRDSLPRMLENLDAPVKAMIGPWIHTWPHEPYPKPGMEWRHEAVRWFDQWLKGKDTGIMDEPAFAVYVREWHPPGPYLEHAPGHWRYEDGWPIERIKGQTYFPQRNHGLSSEPSPDVEHRLRYQPSSGVEAGGPVMWWGDIAHDQRPTDAFSLVYDSEVLSEKVEILGFPRALLKVSVDAPHANWFVRLSDVAPDGSVTQVTGAGFNGAHRQSARSPQVIEPGKVFSLDVEMHFTSWVFSPGHRIRFAVSNAQWPMLWPTPHLMTSSLYLGGEDGTRFLLPVVPAGEERAPQFLPVAQSAQLEGYESLETATSSGFGEVETVTRDLRNGDALAVATNASATRFPWGIQSTQERIEHRTSDQHPESTSMSGDFEIKMELGNRVLLLEGESVFSSDLDNFYLKYTRRLSENGELLRERTWSKTFARDHQ
jgi:predicted acyl esterase